MMWPPILVEPVFRPPSEARSLILQLTLGCSWNRCTYCAMYRTKDFTVRPVEDVLEEVRGAAKGMTGVRRIFLADGDALAAPFEVLEKVLTEIQTALPEVRRVGIYGDSRSTGRFIASAKPTYAAALTVTPVPGTEMYDAMETGAFRLPDQWGMLQELQWMLEEMEGYRGPFHANHASNYLPLKLRLPRDRESAIALIQETLSSRDQSRLRPEWARGL